MKTVRCWLWFNQRPCPIYTVKSFILCCVVLGPDGPRIRIAGCADADVTRHIRWKKKKNCYYTTRLLWRYINKLDTKNFRGEEKKKRETGSARFVSVIRPKSRKSARGEQTHLIQQRKIVKLRFIATSRSIILFLFIYLGTKKKKRDNYFARFAI